MAYDYTGLLAQPMTEHEKAKLLEDMMQYDPDLTLGIRRLMFEIDAMKAKNERLGI